MKFYNGEIVLLPHLTLDPNDFRTSKKTKAAKIPSGERERYWSESLAQAGVDDLPAIYNGEWLVSVGDIYQDVILRQLTKSLPLPRVHNSRTTKADKLPQAQPRWEGSITHLKGGLSLLHNGKVIAPSMCCNELTDLENWQKAAAQRTSGWFSLWNGHPWLYVRYERDYMIFSDPLEDEPPTLTTGHFAIPAPLLQQAVTKASQDLTAFTERFDAYMRSEKR